MTKYGLGDTLSWEGSDLSNLTVEPTVDFNRMSNLEFMKWKRKNKSLYGDMTYDPAYIDAYNQ